MLTVSSNYKTLSSAVTRDIDFRILRNNAETSLLDKSKLVDVIIEQQSGEGNIGIGNVFSSQLTFRLFSNTEWGENRNFSPEVRFLGSTNSEWLSLGVFRGKETSLNKNMLTITAYDVLYNTDKTVTWNGKSASGIPPLTFPATHQQMLDYLCSIMSINNVFKCRNFKVNEKPKGYTQREVLSYIAASHAGNVYIDNAGNLDIKQFEKTNYEIPHRNMTDMSISTKTPFKVNGIAFHNGEDIIFIDGDEEEYSDERPGIIHCRNPFVTIEIAEYVWNKLGGLQYYNCSIEKQGFGYLQCGDMYSAVPLAADENRSFNIVITALKYSLSAELGFKETLTSAALSESQSVNHNNKNFVSTPFGGVIGGSSLTVQNSFCNALTLSAANQLAASISFGINESGTTPLFTFMTPITITNSGNIEIIIVYDHTERERFTHHFPAAGTYTISIPNYPIPNAGTGSHSINVHMRSAGAAGSVPDVRGYLNIFGAGMAGEIPWDGTITARDTFGYISIAPFESFGAKPFTDNLTAFETQKPAGRDISESIGYFSVNKMSFGLGCCAAEPESDLI